jgi:salicylate hydroxylase
MASSTTQENLSPKPLNLAIIGSGLAGLALTIGIFKQNPNIKPTIYEAAPGFAEIGLGVAFGPNAARAMSLISPDILKGFKKHSTSNENAERANTWLSFRYGMQSLNGNGMRYGDLIWHLEGPVGEMGEWMEREGISTRSCVHRARFLDELAALVPEGTAKFGKCLIGVEELGEGGVKLRFADGESVVVDAVVGCDGVKSITRETLMGKSIKPQFTGEYGYRALVPESIARGVMGDELAQNGQLYCGYASYIITYPVEHGKLINMVAVKEKADFEWDNENWIIPSTKEDMLKDFEGWGENLVELISQFEVRDKWGFFDFPHTTEYFRRRMCLLGDSAHASTPHLGAGAGMAFEDAYILSNLLGAVKQPADFEKAFRGFDETRRSRTQRLIMDSRRAGIANKFQGEGIGDNLEKLQPDINARYRWVWEFDLEATLVEANKASSLF